MKFLRFAAGALVMAALLSPVVSRAADSDSRVAQLVAASGKALGVAKLAPYKTMRINATVSAIGLTGTLTQYVNFATAGWPRPPTSHRCCSPTASTGR